MDLREATEIHLPLLHPGLIGNDAAEQIQALAALFPPALTCESMGFETVLTQDHGYADFAFTINFQKHSLEKLSRSLRSTQLNTKKHWSNFVRFLERCNESEDLAKKLEFFWLTFDLNATPDLLAANWPLDPSIYFFFRSHRHRYLIEPTRRFFTSEKLSPDVRLKLKSCYESASQFNLKIEHVGLMCARTLDTIRLHVTGQTLRKSLQPYLSAISYPYDITPLVTYIEQFDPHLGRICLGLDVGHTIGERIGIECCIPLPETVLRQKEIWGKIFAQLSALKLITPEKKEALLNWIGIKRITQGDSQFLLIRTISHFKIIFDRTGISSIKCYFGIVRK